MMIRRLLPTQMLLCGAVVALSALAVPPAYPQGKAPIDEPGIRLDAKDFTRSVENAFKDLIKQNDPPLEGKNATVIDAAAKGYTYPATYTERQTAPGGMAKVVTDFELILQDFPKAAKSGAKNEKLRQKFLERSMERLKEVMGNPRTIARVNGARMLALVAENGYEDVADVLLEVVKDDKAGDGAKYWAYIGLKEVFAQAHQTNEGQKNEGLKNKAREAECILALIQATDRKGPMDGPREEVEGARVLRREAVRALAQARQPVLADAKGKDVKARPALVLLRMVAQPDSYQPSLRLDEQVEAAVGLARVQTKGVPDYQADYAAEHLGKFAVRLAEQYQHAKETKTEKMEPWKVHASRLAEGLEQMKADAVKNAKDRKEIVTYVNDVANQTAGVLQAIEKDQATPARNLGNWLSSNPAKNQTLFRGLPDTAIKVGDPDETPPANKPAEKPADKPGEPKKDK